MPEVYLSAIAEDELKEYLLRQGFKVNAFGALVAMPKGIANHPDLVYCRLTKEVLFKGDESKLGAAYPDDIRYNACSTGKYFIHNLKYTDSRLLQEAEAAGLKLINVPQGYAKCSIAVVSEDTIITYDKGIAKIAEKEMDVLLIEEGHIELWGYNTGFIGGCSGLDPIHNELIFNGDLSQHPDYLKIREFVKAHGVKIKDFKGRPLTDIGSVIF